MDTLELWISMTYWRLVDFFRHIFPLPAIQGIDAVYFNGFEDSELSENGGVTLVMAYTKRYKSTAEILFFLNIPGIGFLQVVASKLEKVVRFDEYLGISSLIDLTYDRTLQKQL